MGENEGDHFREEVGITTSFSQLLFSDIGNNDVLSSAFADNDRNCSAFSLKTPTMLCFDGGYIDDHQNNKPAVTCSDSSPISSLSSATAAAGSGGVTVNVNTTTTKPNRRRTNGSSQEPEKASSSSSTQRSSKKMKMENPCISAGKPKARNKEKLGERIAALQQLVSPFGKTDTASVLHEAMGYIKFLHQQLHLLCSPYLQLQEEGKENDGEEEEAKKDLRSRGLCLVPVDCTLHVANTNGADFWSPAMSSTRQ